MSPVRIGELDKEVELQTKPAIDDAETDSHGEEVEVWTTIRSMYASLRPATGRERVIGEQLENEVSHVVKTRWLQAVDPKVSRLKMGSRIFKIVAVINEDEASRFALYYCLERV